MKVMCCCFQQISTAKLVRYGSRITCEGTKAITTKPAGHRCKTLAASLPFLFEDSSRSCASMSRAVPECLDTFMIRAEMYRNLGLW